MEDCGRDDLSSCTCGNKHKSFGWRRSHHLVTVMASVAATSILLPYIVAIAREDMPAFLPLISQAGGHPPMSGMFAVPLIVMGFFGVIIIILIHESIKHRNTKHCKLLRIANNLSFLVLASAFLGFVMTGAFPVGYTELPNKLEWLVTVLIGHTIGAAMIYAGTALFHFLMTIIWYWLPDATKKMKYFRFIVTLLYIGLFIISVIYTPKYIEEESGPRGYDLDYLKTITYQLPQEFSINYIMCAFGEWIACTLAILNMIALYGDMKRVSLRVTLRKKYCFDTSSISLGILR